MNAHTSSNTVNSPAITQRASHSAWLPETSLPPHDPRRLPLNNLAGWHLAYSENVLGNRCGNLVLDKNIATARLPAELNGSFGGLTLPLHLAQNAPGDIFLLDKKNLRLKKFDPCKCKFLTIPCTGGTGSGSREFTQPSAITICGDNLLVADTGNQRIVIYSLLGFVVRGFWAPPKHIIANWQPVALAVSYDRKLIVGDPANGCVHIFNFGGKWLRKIAGLGAVQALAIDKNNFLYVSQGPGSAIAVVDLQQEKIIESLPDTSASLTLLETRFSENSIVTIATGDINLGAMCARYFASLLLNDENPDDKKHDRWFDVYGEPLTPQKVEQIKTYRTSGLIISEPLDSHFYRCQWDRFMMSVAVPQGTRICVSTFTAESLLTLAQIQDLADDQWLTQQWLTQQGLVNSSLDKNPAEPDWDCLIRSRPGRYLWFKLEMLSDGFSTPEICNIELNYPRISLRRYLPNVFGEEQNSADFTDRFLAIFDRGFRQIEQHVDSFAQLLDPLSAPADAGKSDFLSWLASWIGVSVDRQLPLHVRRNLVKNAGKLYQCRGTAKGLRAMLELILGFNKKSCGPVKIDSCIPCQTTVHWGAPKLILEHFALRRWLFLGVGRLGDQSRLWGQKIVNRTQLAGGQFNGNAQLGVTQLNMRQDPLRDPFYVYAHKFSVFLPAWIERIPAYQKAIARMVAAEKPAHTEHQIIYVAPRFRVGIQSMIGFDSVIGCYPSGVTLGAAALGKASVLSAGDGNANAQRIGINALIGARKSLL